MKKIYIVVIILLFSSGVRTFSQDFSMINEIKKQMSSSEQTELDKAKGIIKEGDDLVESGEKLLNQAEKMEQDAESLSGGKKKKSLKKAEKIKKEAYEKLVEGQTKYEEANKLVYNLYKKNLKTLKATMEDKDKVSQIEELEIEANTYFAQGSTARKNSERQKDNEDKYSFDVEGDQLETDAISIQIQAYSIVYGWFEPDDNEVVEKVEDHIVPEIIVKDTVQTEIVKQTEPKVVFKIQIAASQVELSMSKLHQIYPSNEIIYTDIDGEWFKYLVGNYKTYEEAYEAKSKIGVYGAFIVAYKDNVRVKNITEVCSPQKHPSIDN